MKMPRYNDDTIFKWAASLVQGAFVLVILLFIAANVVNANFITETEIEQKDSQKKVLLYDQASDIRE